MRPIGRALTLPCPVIQDRFGERFRVRAGGIGQVLLESIRGFYYAESAAILILAAVAVTLVDLLSQQLCKPVI